MTRRQPEKALTDLGVPVDLHEPLTALLDAIRPGYMLDTELENARDELAAIDGHLRDAGFDLLGHKGVRDLASVLQGTKTKLSEEQERNHRLMKELGRLTGIEQGLERVLSDLKVDKKGVPGLWRLACWYEDLKDREPSFAEVNRVMLEAGVGSVGLDGVKELINYRDWAQGVLKAIDSMLADVGIQGRGAAAVEKLARSYQGAQKLVDEQLGEHTRINYLLHQAGMSGYGTEEGVRLLVESHVALIKGVEQVARIDIEADEQQEREVREKAERRDAEWTRHKIKQGENALELLGEISGILAQVEHPGSLLDKVRALVSAQKEREELRVAPCHMSVTHLPHITHVWTDSVFGQVRCEGWQVPAQRVRKQIDDPGKLVKECRMPKDRKHHEHLYETADHGWVQCPGWKGRKG